MNLIISHIAYAVAGALFGAVAIEYYTVIGSNNGLNVLLFSLCIPLAVVFGINRKGVKAGKKAHAQTAFISLLLALSIGLMIQSVKF